MNWKDVDWLLGRRFVASMRVLAVGAGTGDAREVAVEMNGARMVISWGELQVLIERGVLVDAEGTA